MRRTARRWRLAYAAVLLGIAVTFLLGDAPVERRTDLDTYYATTPFLAQMILLYLLAHLTAASVTAVSALCWARRVRGGLRAGLLLLGTGSLCGAGYSVAKLVAVGARWSGRDWSALGTTVSPAAAGLGALLTVVGVLVPLVSPRAAEWSRARHGYARLAPLERALDELLTRRTLRLPRPRLASPTTRLVWRQTSIHNALSHLQAYFDGDLYDRARAASLAATRDPERADAAAWAAVIGAAVRREADPAAGGAPPAAGTPGCCRPGCRGRPPSAGSPTRWPAPRRRRRHRRAERHDDAERYDDAERHDHGGRRVNRHRDEGAARHEPRRVLRGLRVRGDVRAAVPPPAHGRAPSADPVHLRGGPAGRPGLRVRRAATLATVNDLTGVPNFGAPLTYGMLSAYSCAVLVLLINWRGGPRRRVRRLVLRTMAAYGLLVAAIVVLFALADARTERLTDLDTYYAATPFMREMILLYLLGHSAAMLVMCAVCVKWGREVGGLLRAGLRLILLGALLDVLGFQLTKYTAVVARWYGHDLDFLSTDVAPPMASLAAVLCSAGFVLPRLLPPCSRSGRGWTTTGGWSPCGPW